MDSLKEFAITVFNRTLQKTKSGEQPQRVGENSARTREIRRLIRLNHGYEPSPINHFFVRRQAEDGTIVEENLPTWKLLGWAD